jgi:hypothetical protein
MKRLLHRGRAPRNQRPLKYLEGYTVAEIKKPISRPRDAAGGLFVAPNRFNQRATRKFVLDGAKII